MSNTKEPLAHIKLQVEHDRHHLFVADRFVASEPLGPVLGEPEALPSIADSINAAVERRERLLRAKVADLKRRVRLARPHLALARMGVNAGRRGRVAALHGLLEIELLLDLRRPLPRRQSRRGRAKG